MFFVWGIPKEEDTKMKEKYDYERVHVRVIILSLCRCCYYYYYDYPSLIIRDSLFVDVFDAFNFVQ